MGSRVSCLHGGPCAARCLRLWFGELDCAGPEKTSSDDKTGGPLQSLSSLNALFVTFSRPRSRLWSPASIMVVFFANHGPLRQDPGRAWVYRPSTRCAHSPGAVRTIRWYETGLSPGGGTPGDLDRG